MLETHVITYSMDFPGGASGKKKKACLPAGDIRNVGSIPGSRRFPWRREWQPTPGSCLENPMD